MQGNPFSDHGSEIKLFAVLLVALALFLGTSVVFGLKVKRGDFSTPTEVVAEAPRFPEVAITAKSAYVYDIRSGEVIYAKDEDVRRPLASLTKVMSALVAADTGLPYSTVTVSAEALKALGDSGLHVDERWSLRDLLDFSLVTSSNDGMRAVALTLGATTRSNASPEEIISDFVLQMNAKASELGLKNTYFYNETGLDESDTMGGAYGSARDVSMLMEHILLNYPELFTATRESSLAISSLDNHVHVARNTNVITSIIPGLLASKTGYTNTAGGNLSVIFDPELGRPIVVTILSSTGAARFSDVETLISATMEYISNQQPTTHNQQ